jgi:hypothetical protein
MKTNKRTNSGKVFGLLAAISFGLLPMLKADVIVLQSGAVITGYILQQDANGVLIQMTYGTFRYSLNSISDVKKEAASAPHVSSNGQIIPDWAQIVSILATNDWADGLKQVPATMIESGVWKNVPYVSFRCGDGGYEVNIFGDLNHPAAVQIGAMNYLHQTFAEKTNCINFICSVLASSADRKVIRALNFDQKDTEQNGGMTIQTILPGEWGSYGGWWVSVQNDTALASAQASEAELLALTQPRIAPAITTNLPVQPAIANAPQPTLPNTQPVVTTTEPGVVTTYGATYAAADWTQEELANAHPATPAPAPPTDYPSATGADKSAATADMVYPRSYGRTDGTYGRSR